MFVLAALMLPEGEEMYVEFENQVLSIGAEFLPEEGRKILRGEELTTEEQARWETFVASQEEAEQG